MASKLISDQIIASATEAIKLAKKEKNETKRTAALKKVHTAVSKHRNSCSMTAEKELAKLNKLITQLESVLPATNNS